jgi:hypothetical protein
MNIHADRSPPATTAAFSMSSASRTASGRDRRSDRWARIAVNLEKALAGEVDVEKLIGQSRRRPGVHDKYVPR